MIQSRGEALRGSLLSFIAMIIAGALLSACATGQKTGVRKDFEQRQIRTLAVASFYSDGRFGLDEQDLKELRELYEAAATAALREQGFEVVDPRAFHQYMVELQAWELFKDGVRLRRPLTNYFELGDAKRPIPIEILTLRQISAATPIPVEAILFGELIYHSQGTCRVQTELATPYARVRTMAGAPNSLPRPCVTSHFQAKLVDVQTGQTMWFNRMLVETHARQIDRHLTKDNIIQVITATLTEDSGLTPLVAPKE